MDARLWERRIASVVRIHLPVCASVATAGTARAHGSERLGDGGGIHRVDASIRAPHTHRRTSSAATARSAVAAHAALASGPAPTAIGLIVLGLPAGSSLDGTAIAARSSHSTS